VSEPGVGSCFALLHDLDAERGAVSETVVPAGDACPSGSTGNALTREIRPIRYRYDPSAPDRAQTGSDALAALREAAPQGPVRTRNHRQFAGPT